MEHPVSKKLEHLGRSQKQLTVFLTPAKAMNLRLSHLGEEVENEKKSDNENNKSVEIEETLVENKALAPSLKIDTNQEPLVKLCSDPKSSFSQQVQEIQKQIKFPNSIIRKLELEGTELLIELSSSVKGNSVTETYTLILPESVRGEWIVINSSDGNFQELGKGSLYQQFARIVNGFAKNYLSHPSYIAVDEPLVSDDSQNLAESGDDFDFLDSQEGPIFHATLYLTTHINEMTDKYLQPIMDTLPYGIYADTTGEELVRVGFPLKFLSGELAQMWGFLNNKFPIILQMKICPPFFFENHSIPEIDMFQADVDILDNKVVPNSYSFGLKWYLSDRLSKYLKSIWAQKSTKLFLDIQLFLNEKIRSCTANCLICDKPLPYEMLKPAVCNSQLCIFAYDNYGLGTDVAAEIRAHPEVVDLLITITYGVCARGDIRRFTPAPTFLEVKKFNKFGEVLEVLSFNNKDQVDNNRIMKTLEALPPVKEMSTFVDSAALKAHLDQTDLLAFPLLRWIITSNRAHLSELRKADHISAMKTDFQFLLKSSPPERERRFQELKEQHGSFYAFHGSDFGNWHSILRTGLKNLSGTNLMTTGASYGNGIYMAASSDVSLGYARVGTGWPKSMFSTSADNMRFQCLALCEVINAGYKPNPYYVVPVDEHVTTRYFFIYNNDVRHSISVSSIMATIEKHNKKCKST